MTLEEAIIHCKEKACDNTQCGLEHRQLAEWLQELQQYRNNARKEGTKMKAPNKIYVPILPRIENSIISEHCVGTAWDNKEHITIPDIEEYIRKDTLLKWAKSKKARLKQGYKHDWKNDDILHGGTLILDSLIDEIESL